MSASSAVQDVRGRHAGGGGVERIQGGYAHGGGGLRRHITLLLAVGGIMRGIGEGLGRGLVQIAHGDRRRVAENVGVGLGDGIGDLVINGRRKRHLPSPSVPTTDTLTTSKGRTGQAGPSNFVANSSDGNIGT